MVGLFPTMLGSGVGDLVAVSGKRWELGIVAVLTRNMASEAGERLQNLVKVEREECLGFCAQEELAVGECLDHSNLTSTNTHLKKPLFAFQIISGFCPI